MTFIESVRTCLGKYATFSGRASRSEYWWFSLFFWVGISVSALISGLTLALFSPGTFMQPRDHVSNLYLIGILPLLVGLGLFLPKLSVGVRRFHDRDLSGWWILGFGLLQRIPYVGFLIGLVPLVIDILKGTSGANRFGPDPMVLQHSADVFA